MDTNTPPPLENHDKWRAAFRAGWLAHVERTGQVDWELYTPPNNKRPISGPGIDLSRSRLALITSSGAYHKGHQAPFDAESLLGDYTIRAFPLSTPCDELDYAHTHYDQAAVRQDPQVLLPIAHLRSLLQAGTIGDLAPSQVHFMGYQPDASRVVDETAPAVLEVLRAEKVDAALLVPA